MKDWGRVTILEKLYSTLQSAIAVLGDLFGPSSSTDGNFALFDGTDGKLLKDGACKPSDFASASDLTNHTGNTSNPHSVTKAQIGLTNVTDNAQVKKLSSSTDGNIPAWDGAGGDTLKDGYSVETTLTGGSSAIARADAVKNYVDALIAASDAMVFEGSIDCSGNPNYPAADCGHTYKISVAGKIGGASGPNVEVGDTLICTADSSASGDHTTVGANWNIIQVNIDGAVIGPSSATDGRLAAFDGATGKLIKDSAYSASDFAASSKGVTNGDSHDHVGGDGAAITESALSLSDVTTGDASTSKHGLMPKTIMTAWSSFTPSWTNLTVGSATNEGYYKQIGKTVFFRVRLIFANNTSISGGVVLTLPVAAASYGTKTAIGLVKVVDDSTGTEYFGNVHNDGNIGVPKNTTYVSQATITASIPFTWATNDTLTIQGFYEAS